MMPGPHKPLLFGAVLANIPLINLRNDHREAVAVLTNPASRHRFQSSAQGLVLFQFPRHEALSLLVRHSVLGVESYLPPAVVTAANRAGTLTPEMARLIESPDRRRDTASFYYNYLPGLLSPPVSLKVANKEVWKQVSRFYAEIRNPLFHGYQLMDEDGGCTLQILEMFSRVYEWIDKWCPQKWFFEPDPSNKNPDRPTK